MTVTAKVLARDLPIPETPLDNERLLQLCASLLDSVVCYRYSSKKEPNKLRWQSGRLQKCSSKAALYEVYCSQELDVDGCSSTQGAPGTYALPHEAAIYWSLVPSQEFRVMLDGQRQRVEAPTLTPNVQSHKDPFDPELDFEEGDDTSSVAVVDLRPDTALVALDPLRWTHLSSAEDVAAAHRFRSAYYDRVGKDNYENFVVTDIVEVLNLLTRLSLEAPGVLQSPYFVDAVKRLCGRLEVFRSRKNGMGGVALHSLSTSLTGDALPQYIRNAYQSAATVTRMVSSFRNDSRSPSFRNPSSNKPRGKGRSKGSRNDRQE